MQESKEELKMLVISGIRFFIQQLARPTKGGEKSRDLILRFAGIVFLLVATRGGESRGESDGREVARALRRRLDLRSILRTRLFASVS